MGLTETLNSWGHALSQTLQGQLDSGSPAAIFVVFAAGVLTSLTPCVYPMIPVTVTYIGGASAGNRRRAISLSLVYASGLALIYAGLGVGAAMLGTRFGADTRSPWIYSGVAALMVLLGAAMIGWLDIPVPGFAGDVQQRGVKKGGYLGALLMGIAAGFVAAPCTAPVLGVLLFYVARSRDVLWGGALMLVFSAGLSLLLMILGIFSGLLTNLPAAGRWMDFIKKFFGIAMFIVAAYFFYQAVQMWM